MTQWDPAQGNQDSRGLLAGAHLRNEVGPAGDELRFTGVLVQSGKDIPQRLRG
jgi:hypothetical protein